MREYDHKKIEQKWQKEWDKKKLYSAKEGKGSAGKKSFILVEFPFPSGAGLHTGHIRSYTALDIVARKRRMEGKNVLYPIGWDAFGLPTEQYAIKTGKSPAKVTKENTDTFRRQLKAVGLSFDWQREVNTTDPAYYKWTQWIFLQFYKKGLAYKTKTVINWCPKDKIGLANEEVVDGGCERCGTPVEKKEKEQWMLAITKYADRLDTDLDSVDYPERVKTQQRNWIGKSEGSEIDFTLSTGETVTVFTTRADTIFGATYAVLAPEHPIVSVLKDKIENASELEVYIREAKKKDEITRTASDKEKTGVELKGVSAKNPATGKTIPLWVADYVLPQYGTGAVMAVPAHDERDFAFAKKYGLPVQEVIEPLYVRSPEPTLPFVERQAISAVVKHWSEDKYLGLKWKKVDWGTFVTGGIEAGQTPEEAARAEITEETGYTNLKLVQELPNSHSKFYHAPKKENRFGHFHNFYFELTDGTQKEISLEEQEKHSLVWLSPGEVEKFLTPEAQIRDWKIARGEFTPYTDEGILFNSGTYNGMDSEEARTKITKAVGGRIVTKYKLRDWVFSRQRYWGEPIPLVHCPKDGWVPVPEKDLPVKLPVVKSYMPTDTGESPLAQITKWVNTKCPKCKGKATRETDTMPNWAGSSWYYLRYADPKNKTSFADAKKLKYWTPVDWYNGGMEHTTLHLLYSRFWHKFLYDMKLVPTKEPYAKRTSHGLILAEGGIKMSKSKGNIVNPDDIVKMYGADTLRLYEMFMGPFEQPVAWSSDALIGPRRFIERLWKLSSKTSPKHKGESYEIVLNQTIKKITEDIETLGFNTAVSQMMICLNEMEKSEVVAEADFKKFLQVLAPFAPHVTEELWGVFGEKKSIHVSKWPLYNPAKLVSDMVTIAIQVNGKVRAEIRVSRSLSDEEIKKQALGHERIQALLEGNEPKRVIYVPGRLINIVA